MDANLTEPTTSETNAAAHLLGLVGTHPDTRAAYVPHGLHDDDAAAVSALDRLGRPADFAPDRTAAVVGTVVSITAGLMFVVLLFMAIRSGSGLLVLAAAAGMHLTDRALSARIGDLRGCGTAAPR